MARKTTVKDKDAGFTGLGVAPVVSDLRSAANNIMGCNEEVPKSRRKDVLRAETLINEALACLLRADPRAMQGA